MQYCTNGCGYSIKLPKQKHVPGSLEGYEYLYSHGAPCTVCGTNTGITGECKNDQGQVLGCKTGIAGTCATCGKVRGNQHLELKVGKCAVCQKEFYTATTKKEVISPTQIKFNYTYTPTIEGLELNESKSEIAYLQNAKIVKQEYTKQEDGTLKLELIVDISEVTEAKSGQVRGRFHYTYQGSSLNGFDPIDFYPDSVSPVVKEITVEGGSESGEFSRSATITAKFEENWDSMVSMALYDADGSVISDWGNASKEGSTFTRKFDVIAETTTQKELTVKAKDRCGNIGEGKVKIGKIDTKAPTIQEQINPQETWSMYKDILLEVRDEGAGEVEIALNKTEEYEKASKEENTYKKQYRIVGDIYENIGVIIYAKDGVGNVSSKRMTIGNIDMTSPTITNLSIEIKENKKIIVEANDKNTKLNKEGSGIKGYAISKSREVPNEKNFQASHMLTVHETGMHYVWVMDNAGNISKTHEIKVE